MIVAEALQRPTRERWALLSGALVAALGLYVLGLDQGLLLSLVQGSAAFDQNLVHEALHDARHAAGFPCH